VAKARQAKQFGKDSRLLNYEKPDRVRIGIIYPLEFSARVAGGPRAVDYRPEKSFSCHILTFEMFGWNRVPIEVGRAILSALDFGAVVKTPKNNHQQRIAIKS
jgi:hypothetical protein